MDISKETFARIIQATASGVNWERFGVAVAIADPDLFVRVIEETADGWKAEAKIMKATGATKVEVTKYIRNETKMGLKEAIDWVSNNMDYESEDNQ